MRYATDRVLGVQQIVTMAEAGDISAEQALRAIAVESGLREQSDASKRLGALLKQVADGEAPASALVAWVDDLDEMAAEIEDVRDVSDVVPDVAVIVTRSAGDDRAVLVFIDTSFEPDASDGGPGLRVLINDDEAYEGKKYDLGGNHEAGDRKFTVGLDEIAYTGKESR